MKEVEEKLQLLLERSQSELIDDVVWVRVLKPTLERSKI